VGLLYWVIVARQKNTTLRFFGLRAFRFQIYFSLLVYPIFTAVTFIGDWRTIYDFGATPLLSGLTAVVHLAILAWYFWADRTGRFEMVAHEDVMAQQKFAALQTEAALNPQDEAAQLAFVEALWRGRAINRARRYLKRFLQQRPNSGEAYFLQAMLALESKRTVPKTAVSLIHQALQMGIKNPRKRALAHHVLGQYYLEREDYTEAIQQFSQVIALSSVEEEAARLAEVYRGRSLAYRRQKQYDLAYQDIQQAIQIAQASGNEGQLQSMQEELNVIEQHAGRR
jgi:tetratricopeptide (TPR) repeat protein